MKLVATRAELCSLDPLHQEVASLRDDIVHRISDRFPAEEAIWMSLLNFSQGEYPSGVVKQKFRNVAAKLKHLVENFNNDLSADRFLADYLKVKASHELMIESGAEKSNISVLSRDQSAGPEWMFYMGVVDAIPPTSADAERAFSVLTRLKTMFRKRLYKHLPALMRISQSHHMGTGSSFEDKFIYDVLLTWDGLKARRYRQTGYLRGPNK